MNKTCMRIITSAVLLLGLLGWVAVADAEKKKLQLVKARCITARGGLPNVARKLKNGEEVKVVLIGGSITVGGQSTKAGFCVRVPQWIQDRYPGAKVIAVNAGIGGTGSSFGSMRYDRDVLAHKPDLVFVEFAVNDGRSDASVSMERIVRKTWMANPKTDIVFIYTLSQHHLPDYKNGFLPIAASSHERVAEHYSIPTVGMAKKVADLVNSGKIEWKDFSRDGCHPHTEGYKFFVEEITTGLESFFKTGEPGEHKLGEPLKKGLVVYKPKVKPIPIPEPAPLVNKGGKSSVITWSVPIVGVHWVDTAIYKAEGRVLWKLYFQDVKNGGKIARDFGLSSDKWTEPAIWFEEARYFTGSYGTRLVGSYGPDALAFGSTRREMPVLIFVAPKTGKYAFRATADRLSTWRAPESFAALNVVRFPKGQTKGESVAFYKETVAKMKNMDFRSETELNAGDELAFVFDENARYGVGFRVFRLRVGYFGK